MARLLNILNASGVEYRSRRVKSNPIEYVLPIGNFMWGLGVSVSEVK